MKIRMDAACGWSIVLAVGAMLLPPLGAASTNEVETKQSAPSGDGTVAPRGATNGEFDSSKSAGNQSAVKDTTSSAANARGLSDADLAKRILMRCRARPELCMKRHDDAQGEPPRGPASDNGPKD
jgi:hypothetical protein